MSIPSELQAALEALLDELDRLMLVGEPGRRRRGVTSLSVENLRYLRMAVARVLAGDTRPDELRGASQNLADGLTDSAPLRSAVQRVEALL